MGLSFVGPPSAAFVFLEPDTHLQGDNTCAFCQRGPRSEDALSFDKNVEKKLKAVSLDLYPAVKRSVG